MTITQDEADALRKPIHLVATELHDNGVSEAEFIQHATENEDDTGGNKMTSEVMKQALEDISGAKLCEINSMSSRMEMLRLMDKAINDLQRAIVEQGQYYKGDVLVCNEDGEKATVRYGNAGADLKLANGLICLEWSDTTMGDYTPLQLSEGFTRLKTTPEVNNSDYFKQEPVGKFAKFTDGIWREVTAGSAGVPLYTTPPQCHLEPTTDMMMELADRLGELPDDVDPRAWSHLLVYAPKRQPLTHEQRVDLLAKFEAHKHEWHAPAILIDMVEAAHNIGDKT